MTGFQKVSRDALPTWWPRHMPRLHSETRQAPSIMMGLGAQLSKAFIDSPDIFQPAATLEFHALYEDALSRSKMLLNRRSEEGLVRRCHGDMHAGNIIVEDGAPKLFDAIEFSEKIATIDVLYDLAFLLMDLWTHDEKRAANIILNRYLHLRRREEDLSGLALLPLFLSTRAGVRALVSADLAHELPLSSSMKPRGQALDWFRASIAFLKPPRPCLVCIGGLSGTGKSTLAAAPRPGHRRRAGSNSCAQRCRAEGSGGCCRNRPPAARRPIRERHRWRSMTRASPAPREPLQQGTPLYSMPSSPTPSSAVPQRPLQPASGADFHGFWLEAPEELLKSRVTARKADASDATADVVEKQLAYRLGPIDWHRVDASHTPAETLAAVRERLRCPVRRPSMKQSDTS